MDRQSRLSILREGVANSTKPVLQKRDYKDWLLANGWEEGEDTEKTLDQDIRDFRKEGNIGWLTAGMQWMARQTDNLNVKLGATRDLREEAKEAGLGFNPEAAFERDELTDDEYMKMEAKNGRS